MNNKHSLSWVWTCSRVLLLGGLSGVVAISPALSQTKEHLQTPAKSSILSVGIKSFAVKDADMEEALRTLSDQITFRIVIGFERIPHYEGHDGPRMSFDLTNTTVGEILHRLCEKDSRYEYRPVEGQMVDVFSKGSLDNPDDLLNIKVREYRVDAPAWPGGVIATIAQDVPELRELLERKKQEWLKKRGASPGGTPGSLLSGNGIPPRFVLHLKNVTVRQILNAISLESVRMFKAGKVYAPSGWEYDFIISATAQTTLGGYPQWKEF